MGRKKHHIIAISLLYHFINISGDSLIFFITSSHIFTGHIICQKQLLLFFLKGGLCIDFIILLFPTQKLLIILYGQKCCREQNRAASSVHTVLEIIRRIHAEELEHKLPLLHLLAVHHIIIVHNLIHIQEMSNIKIKIQKLTALRHTVMFLQKFIHGGIGSGQCHNKRRNHVFPSVIHTFPLHSQKLLIAFLQLPLQLGTFLLD